MERVNSSNWSVGDKITADRLNDFNLDLDELFIGMSNENLSSTYNVLGYLEQVVDNENGITINLDWADIGATTPLLYIQKVGDPKKYTITYSGGYLSSIEYA